MILQGYTGIIQILHIQKYPTPILAQFHDIAHIIRRCQDFCLDHRFFCQLNQSRVWIIGRVVNHFYIPVCHRNPINNRWCSGNQVQIIFPFQPFLNNFHMQQPQESAAESEAQCNGCFRFKGQRGIVQLQLLQCFPQIAILCTICRIDTREHHWIDFPITRQRFCTRIVCQCHRVTNLCITNALNGGGQIANFASRKLPNIDQPLCIHIASFYNGKFCTRCHQANGIANFHRSLFDTNINYNTLIGIIIAVENQGFQRCVRVTVRGRNIRDNAFHHFANIDSLFGGNPWSIHCRNSDDAFNLLTNPFRIGCWQVNLIDNWNDFQIMFNCQIGICQGLSFNAL